MTSELTSPVLRAAPIDALAPLVGGVYRDEVVEVLAYGQVRPRRSLHMIRTRHFDVTQIGDRVHVGHGVPPERIDDDLAGLLADELFGPGWLRGPELFERIFTGVVVTSALSPAAAWELFYRNTLRRIEESVGSTAPGHADSSPVPSNAGRHGTVSDYAPVYRHAQELVAGESALELGCCFGFLSLRLAAAGRRVLATDVSAGTVRLLTAMAPRLGLDLATRVADAARFPGADGLADTVLAVHLLEHLDPEHGDRVIGEALRLATRRVVVAVPLEEEADATWGHVRTVSLADLDAWGAASGRPYDVHEHHGGWLVVDVGSGPSDR